MKIVSHFPTGVETINVNKEDKKVMVENQSYSPHCHNTKYHTSLFNFGEVPPHIWGKIKKEKLRIEEEKKRKK